MERGERQFARGEFSAALDDFPDRGQRGAAADRLDLGSAEVVGDGRQFLDGDVGGNRLAPQADTEDLAPAFLVGQANRHLDIEPAGPQQGRIQQVRAIRGAQDQHARQFFDAVHLGQELADDALADMGIRIAAAASGHQGVQFIEEDDTRAGLAGLLEHLPDSLFRFADVLGQQGRALDRDEVDLALVRHGFGEQGFAAAGRPRQEHAFGRPDAGSRKQGRVFQGPLDGLDQLALDVLQSADIVPVDVRHFDEHLADRRRVHFLQGLQEMGHLDLEFAQRLVGDLGGGEVDFRQDAAEADHGGLAAQGFQVGADEAVGDRGQTLHFDVGGQGHAAAVDLQDFAPAVAVGDRDRDLAVKAARPAEGRIECVGDVGGPDHNHVLAFRQAVHQGQQLGHHPFFHIAHDLLALGGDRIQFVQEDDAGRLAGGLVKDLAEVGLGLAVELVDDLGAVHGKKLGLGLMGHGAGDQRLAAARRAVQQDAFRRIDPQPLEDLRIAERQLDDLANPLQFAFQSADLFVGQTPPRVLFLLLARCLGLAHLQRGPRVDHHGARRHRAGDLEVGGACAEQAGPQAVARHHRQAVQQAADVSQVAFPQPDSHRQQDDPFGRPNGNLVDLDQLVDGRAGVIAGQAVDLNPRLAAEFLVGRHDLGEGLAFPAQFDDVPDFDAQLAHITRIEPREAPADVFRERFGNLELGEALGGSCHRTGPAKRW